MPKPQDIYVVHINDIPDWRVAGAFVRSDKHYSLAATALQELCTTVHAGTDRWIGGAVHKELTQDDIQVRMHAFGADAIRLIIQGPTAMADVEARLGEEVVDAAIGARPTQYLEF